MAPIQIARASSLQAKVVRDRSKSSFPSTTFSSFDPVSKKELFPHHDSNMFYLESSKELEEGDSFHPGFAAHFPPTDRLFIRESSKSKVRDVPSFALLLSVQTRVPQRSRVRCSVSQCSPLARSAHTQGSFVRLYFSFLTKFSRNALYFISIEEEEVQCERMND